MTDNVRLHLSHVIPAWAYERVRNDRPGENPSPIQIQDGEARYNQKQIKEHMLCFNCEQKFGVYDDEVSRLASDNGVFPAMQRVGSMIAEVDGMTLANAGSLDASRLAFFACSVVWRGHCAKCSPECSLGPLGETFRRFLNGERSLPSTLQISLALLWNDWATDLGKIMKQPQSTRKRPHHSHEFATCGMYFAVRTGASHSDVECSLASSTPTVWLVGSDRYLRWFGAIPSARFVGKKPPLSSKGVRLRT